MAKIIFLGTSSSIPTKKRDNTSFIFTNNKLTLLIDCPGSITQKLLKVGLSFKTIKKIIITHQHPDHIYGIISLIHTQAYFNNLLTIFANQASIKVIKKLIKLFQLDEPQYPKIKYINVFKRKFFLRQGGIEIAAIKNRHIPGSFGVKISFSKKKLFYSSDTAFSQKMLKLAGYIDYLIHDCTASSSYFKVHPSLNRMHTSSKVLSDYLKTCPKVKLIPVHFLLQNKNEERRIKEELRPIRDKIIWPEDLKTIVL